ncbi:hypothetical protein GCM10020367_12620 [Streptomyces sannanensis]|uniref:Uncharacterized protein n=1 Tax=Streptomyces sannanensis TaxID=285536 RepID=A0ABP6S7V7_9ACTN
MDAAGGFILVPHPASGGLANVVGQTAPLLPERVASVPIAPAPSRALTSD